MIACLKPYPVMKDSGVEWLGEVPEHWEMNRLGYCATLIVPMRDKPEDLGGEIPWVRIEDFTGRYIGASRSRQGVSMDTVRKMNLKVFPEGTVLCSCSCSMGATAIASHPIVSNQTFIGIHPQAKLDSEYVFWLMQVSKDHLTQIATGAIQQYLARSDFGSLKIPLPSLPEQAAIVRYLDHVDRRIRRYIRAKQKLIKLLEEQKQTIIHRAVTRGLDPDVPLKPSGVEWLGKVPEHWNSIAVKRHYSIQLGKMLQNRANEARDVEVPYLKAQHVQWFSVRTADAPKMWASPHDVEQFGVRAGDLLVCEGGEGGRCGLIKDVEAGYIIQNALHRIRPSDNCRNDYLQYVMSSIAATGWFDAINSKATIAHFTREKFSSLGIPLPPLPEQAAIVEHLDKATADINTAIAHARREIPLLREYRTRLIADVVTGKLDVRAAAAGLPEEPDNVGANDYSSLPMNSDEEMTDDLNSISEEGEE